MKSCHKYFCVIFFTLLMSACAPPPEVIQGTVVSYDPSTGVLTVEDELSPGTVSEFSALGAEMGAELQTGDLVRLACYRRGDTLEAIRIMNISRQEELGKSAAGH